MNTCNDIVVDLCVYVLNLHGSFSVWKCARMRAREKKTHTGHRRTTKWNTYIIHPNRHIHTYTRTTHQHVNTHMPYSVCLIYEYDFYPISSRKYFIIIYLFLIAAVVVMGFCSFASPFWLCSKLRNVLCFCCWMFVLMDERLWCRQVKILCIIVPYIEIMCVSVENFMSFFLVVVVLSYFLLHFSKNWCWSDIDRIAYNTSRNLCWPHFNRNACHAWKTRKKQNKTAWLSDAMYKSNNEMWTPYRWDRANQHTMAKLKSSKALNEINEFAAVA